MSAGDYDCPPYAAAVSPPADATILDLAALAARAADDYCTAMDNRADYRMTLRTAGALARATQALTTAIADAVACGDNSLS